MKFFKLLIVGIIVVIGLTFTGCNELIVVNGSGKMKEKEFELSNFEHVVLNNLVEATIIQSDEYKVLIETNENVIEYLEINVKDSTLNLKMKSGIFYKGVICKATVYMPKLNKVELSGISKLNIEEFKTEKLNLDLYGNTRLKGQVDVQDITIQSSGSVRYSTGSIKIELLGKANYANVKLSGDSELLGKELTVKTVELDSKGPTKITLTVADSLKGELEGASKIQYYGNPVWEDVYTSGFAQVIKM